MPELWVCAEKKWVGGLKNDISIINFNIYIRLWFDMAIWTHVLNFTVLFSVSPTQLCITLNAGQVHVAQLWQWLWGIACVSESCVTDIMCHGLFDARLVLGKQPWSSVIPCSVLIRDHLWLSSSWSAQLGPSPHSGCTWQEIQTEKKKNKPQETSLLSPSKCCYFLTYIYIPT